MRTRRLFFVSLVPIIALAIASPATAKAGSSVTAVIAWQQLGAVQQLADRQPDVFTGVVVDKASSTARVYVGAAATQRATALLSGVPAGPASDPQLKVQVVPVKYSSRDLQQTVDAVAGFGPWASALTSWYVDPVLDKVHVGLTTVTAGLRDAATTGFGDKVALYSEQRHVAAVKRDEVAASQYQIVNRSAVPGSVQPTISANRLTDATPYFGGDRIIYWTSCGNGRLCITQCTANFEMFSASSSFMASAGHCGPNGTLWYQGYLDSAAHQIVTTGTMGTVSNIRWGNNQMDAELLSGGDYDGYVYRGVSSYDPVAGTNTPSVGEDACTDGSFSNENCGATIRAVNACLNLQEGSTVTTVCNQAIAQSINSNPIVQSGDSGGPVFIQNNSLLPLAQGIISGGNLNSSGFGTEVNFTQIQNATSTFGVQVASIG